MKQFRDSPDKMKMEQFIGIFPNAVNNELCSEFINWFNLVSEQQLTMSAMEESGMAGTNRKDESLFIPSGLTNYCFPGNLCQPFWKILFEHYQIYNEKYIVNERLTSYSFKAHRVQVSGGYHQWHHEHNLYEPRRILVWMLILEAPEKGGETEFLLQSMRVEPNVGQLTIWPAGFTHKHRGNPPLEGQKTYLSGWFELVEKDEPQKKS